MIVPMPPVESPWYKLASVALPNVKWCEEQLTGWIIEPANTWSNLPFIFFGIYMLFHCRKYKDPFLRLFAPGALIVGIGSLVYHMSYNFFTQILDFYGMYIIFLVPLMFNFRRLNWISESNLYSYYFMLTSALTGLVVALHVLHVPVQLIIVALIVLTIVTEVMLSRRKEPHRASYKHFFYAIGFLAIGGTFSALDASRIYCNPEDHIFQGHSIWHVMCALTIWFTYKFYTQFDQSEFYRIK